MRSLSLADRRPVASIALVVLISLLFILPQAAATGNANTSSSLSCSQPQFLGLSLQQPSPDPQHRSFPHQLWRDASSLAGSRDFYLMIGGIAACPIVFKHAFDRETSVLDGYLASSPAANKFFEVSEGLGQAAIPLATSVSLWAVGRVVHSDFTQSLGSTMLRAQIVNGMLTLAMKASINRTRPNGGLYSYPSGHTSISFCTAAVICDRCGAAWGVPALVVASCVGVSRLRENKHYLTDVLAGGLLGSYIGFKIAHQSRSADVLHVHPFVDRDASGLAVAVSF